MILASLANRARMSGSWMAPGSITLSARRRSVTSSTTSYTAPMPPALMERTTRYRPWKIVSGLSGARLGGSIG
ncbi:hypothetical protein BE08_21165 [Sorangium cellulosum]|uniref:Uncharacterized protein n=1 Tax=Sorangium cellulosum TaxID=56 RepID=A0A150P767_SORCE|nr:hypothetical protein BE08_21165 [Sorangium cellulosum]